MKSNDVKKRSSITASALQGLQLFLIQSSVCILTIVVVLLIRWIGGDIYDEVAEQFRSAMLENTLFSIASAEETSTDLAENESLVKTTAPLIGGVITSSYGMRELSSNNPSSISFHEGIDIAAEEGTPLAAMRSGTVRLVAYEENGYGHYVVVACENNIRYLYAHCQRIVVTEGEQVTTGQTIAYVGNTGRSTGSHVHLEWIENEQTIDPIRILPEKTYV